MAGSRRAATCIPRHQLTGGGILALVGVLVLATGARGQTGARDVRIGDATADESVVRLVVGPEAGLKKGQVYDVYDDARVYALPLTNGQEPVVRAQQVVASIVIVEAAPGGALARIFAPRGTKAAALKDRLCLANPARPYDDQPPLFVRDLVNPPAASWRQPIDVRFEVANEPGQRVLYTWTAPQGGALAAERTLVPRNRWLPPARPGKYPVVIEAHDAAGKTTKHQVEIESKGLAGPGGKPGTTWKALRTLGAQARFEGVRDIAVDREGDTYILERTGGFSSKHTLTLLTHEGEELGRSPVTDQDAIAVAVSDDALFLLDRDSKTVRRYPKKGAEPTKLVEKADVTIGEKGGGAGPGRLTRPIDLAVSPDGQAVYVLDADQRFVHVFSRDGRLLHTLGAPAKEASKDVPELEAPSALAIGEDGTVFVLDDGKTKKRVVSWKDGLPVAELEAGVVGQELRGLAVDAFSGDVYVLERTTGVVNRFARDGRLVAKSKPVENGIEALEKPARLRMDGSRTLTILDREGMALVRLDEELSFRGRSGGVKLGGDLRLAASSEGEVVVLDQDSRQLTRFDRQGFVLARFGGGEQMPKPIGIAVDAAGEVFVLDAESAAVLRFNRLGGFLGSSRGDAQPAGNMDLLEVRDIQASSERDRLMIAQNRNYRTLNLMDPRTLVSKNNWPPKPMEFENVVSAVLLGKPESDAGASSFWVIDKKGERLLRTYFAEGLREIDKLDKARDLAASIGGTVFVCDRGAKVVKAFDGSGTLVGNVADEEKCPKPLDLAVDDYGRVFVYDSKSDRIVEFSDN